MAAHVHAHADCAAPCLIWSLPLPPLPLAGTSTNLVVTGQFDSRVLDPKSPYYIEGKPGGGLIVASRAVAELRRQAWQCRGRTAAAAIGATINRASPPPPTRCRRQAHQPLRSVAIRRARQRVVSRKLPWSEHERGDAAVAGCGVHGAPPPRAACSFVLLWPIPTPAQPPGQSSRPSPSGGHLSWLRLG